MYVAVQIFNTPRNNSRVRLLGSIWEGRENRSLSAGNAEPPRSNALRGLRPVPFSRRSLPVSPSLPSYVFD